jgi:DNA helicase-2/ATP-dependent DNA helicase PcrA
LGARIIERFRQKGVSEGRERVLDRKESLSVFRSAAKDLGLHCPPGSVLSLYDRVGRLKQDLIQETLVTDNDLARAYDAYEDHLKRAGALDLDDLLIHAVRLLRGDSVETRRIRDTFARHLCIDEFQDVNRVQYEMVRLLSGQEGRRLFVIGDPDQAIYGFRGADWRYFDQLKEDYPSAKEVFLTRNYRSRPAILKAAHCVLDRSCMARLQCERDEGGPVQVASLGHSTSEGHFITRTIDSMVGGASFLSVDSQMEGASVGKSMGFEDFAVLYRLNAVGDALEESFRASGIPFQRIRRENPEEEAEARDPRARAVSLMTIHAAKGLEFPVVFIAGCEDGIIPYSGTDDAERTPPDPEEERRLLYVAMTRAQDHLFLTSSSRRVLFGRTVRSRPAPFLRLVDKSLCVSVDTGSNRNVDWAPGPVQGELFHI